MPNEKWTGLKAAAAGFVSICTALFGAAGWSVVVWLCATVLDYLTGTLAAICLGEWSSRIAREGLWHKAGSIAAVLVAGLCDIAIGVMAESRGISLPGAEGCLITPAVTAWYIFTELGSIVENADKLGAPMPEFLKKHLRSLRERTEEDKK